MFENYLKIYKNNPGQVFHSQLRYNPANQHPFKETELC